MSFVKRTDGTVVHTGGHITSRGSLESIRYGSSAPATPEDFEWEKRVLAVAGSLDMANYYYEDDSVETEIISRLWGIYKRAEPKFNSDYFEPSGR